MSGSGSQSLSKLNAMNKAAEEAKEEVANLGLTKIVEEKRTQPIQSYIKPSEYEEFIGLIGRQPVSDVVRDLVLEFVKSQRSK